MNSRTRRTLFAWPLACALLASCAMPTASVVPPEVRAALAPTGTLRVGVYPGSPTSLVRGPGAGEMRGVSVDLGRELARQLGVPAEIVVYERVAEVVRALKEGRADFTVTNASPARARDVDFTTPLIGLELGCLVLPGSPVRSVDAMDLPGARIAVSEGGSSHAALTRVLKRAVVVPAPSLAAAAELLKTGQVDAFATNKAILFELADSIPGARVLDGRWGLEHLAIAVPKDRGVARPYLQRFADAMRDSGAVRRAAERAGLRGTAAPDAP